MAGCHKQRYASHLEANTALLHIWAKRLKRGHPARRHERRAYLCPCGHWHLTRRRTWTPEPPPRRSRP